MTVQDILDTLADLQIKAGVGGVGRERILVTLLPPPADSSRREAIRRQLDDAVPELLTRYQSAGALPPAYELSRQGWLQTRYSSRVLDIIKAFLEALRAYATSGASSQRLEWPDLVAQGLPDSEYHLTCIVARCFALQNGGTAQSWNGRDNAPYASFGVPVDFDELLDVVSANDLVTRRQRVPYVRLQARKVINGELTGHVRRAVGRIYKSFSKTGLWPLSRTLHVQLASEDISLETIASGRFVRGHDVSTEGARTMLTLAGLLIPAEAEEDRQLVVNVLRFIGKHSRSHPEDRTIDALTVMDRLGLDEEDTIAAAKMLQAQGSAYVTTASDTFNVAKMLFYVSPEFIAHADAEDLWDIVLNEEVARLRWQVQGLDGIVYESVAANDDTVGTDDLDDLAAPREARVQTVDGEPSWGEYGEQDLADLVSLLRRNRFEQHLMWMCTSTILPFSLLMIDIDKFKQLNDSFGHRVGDAVLVKISTIVREVVGRRGLGYRYGGEELSALLPGFTWQEAMAVGERIRAHVESEVWPHDHDARVTISIGVAERMADEVLDCFVRRTDHALYQAKQSGRNRVVEAAHICLNRANMSPGQLLSQGELTDDESETGNRHDASRS